MFLEMQRVQLLEGDVWGHRKDITEYYSVPSSVIERITEMKNEGKSTDDIKKEVSRRTKTNPDMIGYILTKEIST
jgi:ribosomal protein S19